MVPRLRIRVVMRKLFFAALRIIIINHNVKVVVLEIRGNKVRLGVDAPQDVPVQREELKAKIGQDYPVRWNVLPFSRAMADDNAPRIHEDGRANYHRKPFKQRS